MTSRMFAGGRVQGIDCGGASLDGWVRLRWCRRVVDKQARGVLGALEGLCLFQKCGLSLSLGSGPSATRVPANQTTRQVRPRSGIYNITCELLTVRLRIKENMHQGRPLLG